MAVYLFDDYDLLRDNRVPEYYEKRQRLDRHPGILRAALFAGVDLYLLFATEELWIGSVATIH
ncbi:hypothetical protein [Paenibacillus lautus]|uniref:hypothetical protein n=1 Tax=Paenibacillus lautus TaxID=1401 RepID=UPI001FEA854E|nr:hypothetical protein [Paenibacillus lautus]